MRILTDEERELALFTTKGDSTLYEVTTVLLTTQDAKTARLVREETLKEVGKWFLNKYSEGDWVDYFQIMSKLSQGVMPGELILECCGKSESQCKCE